MADPEREAWVIYHLRRAEAEIGLAHSLTDSREVQHTTEPMMASIGDLLYSLEQGLAEEPPWHMGPVEN